MNARVDHLLHAILALPSDERSAVAAALIDGLGPGDDAAIAQEWKLELLQRRDALRSGATQALPWSEVRARLGAL